MVHLLKKYKVGRKFIAKTVFIIGLFLLFLHVGYSQDAHLTQFNYSPLLLNPAQTGNFYGDWRAGLNFRNQWASTGAAYNTAVFFGDKKFSLFGQKIGAGALVISDMSAGVSRTKVYASGSYFNNLAENYFSIGLQAGMVFSSPGLPEFNNYDRFTDDHSLVSGELGAIEKGSYLDFNFGALWNRKINIFEPEIGVSLSHLNNPTESFANGTSKVGLTSKIHAGLKTNLNDEIYVMPTGLFATNSGNSITVLGSDVGYNLLGNRSSVKKLFAGIYVSNGLSSDLSDLTLLIGATIGRIDLAINYDLNVTSMSNSQNVSTFEVSLIYRSISTVLNSYSIPCERF